MIFHFNVNRRHLLKFSIEIQLIYNAGLVSGVQQSDSDVYMLYI